MKIFTKIRRVFSESNCVQRKAIKKVDLVTMDLDYFKMLCLPVFFLHQPIYSINLFIFSFK